MNVINRRVDELTPYANNAKRHDARQIKNVATSIEKYGFIQPVVIDRDGVIIIGHCRVLAAKKLKMAEVPCVCADELTPEEVNALRLIDNKVAESDWDVDLLAAELPTVDVSDFDIDWGVEPDEEVVEVPPPPVNNDEPARTQMGDRWHLGRHVLLCGDSTKLDDVEKLVGGAEINMLLTDPPYNVDYGHMGSGKEAVIRHRRTDGKIIQNDNMPDDEFRQFLIDAFTNAFMVMKPGAAFHIWHAGTETYNFSSALHDAGGKIRQVLIWVKNSIIMGRQDFQWQHEPCLYGEKELPEGEFNEETDDYGATCLYGWVDGSKHYFYKNRRQSTVMYFDKPQKSPDHPTMKPIKLFDYEIKCNSQKGDNILDLFGGSGTTLMACEQDGRTAFIMEFDPKYCDVILKRWEDFTGETAILEETENV